MTVRAWPEPAAGDTVWCHFPDGVHPRPKPRLGLILTVFGERSPFNVTVAYGTSQCATQLHRGEFLIQRTANAAAFAAANLSFDTKFDLRRSVDLPYTSEWLSVPPAAPHGEVPQLGTLRPSLVRTVQTACRAARD